MTRVPPGGVIGILGGGQLARMMALEAHRMGYRVAVLGADENGSAGQVCDLFFKGELDDLDAARKLAHASDVLTLDTEHVPSELLAELESITPVRPSANVLGIVQDRLAQRRFLALHKVPQVLNAEVSDLESLQAAGDRVGYPCILKTRRSGYDGKGQARAECAEDLQSAWKSIGNQPAVAEAFVPFEREVSVLLSRDLDGKLVFHPIAENDHRHHVLHTTRVPARLPADLTAKAEQLGAGIAVAMDYVGMMAIELFVTKSGELLVNEIAPRTHNSGHYTFGACATSQFEQHIRAICGLPLGDSSLLRPVAMLNLLGDLWANGEPDWTPVLACPEAKLHLYGKQGARPGRKMGHILVLGDGSHDSAEHAVKVAHELERAMTPVVQSKS